MAASGRATGAHSSLDGRTLDEVGEERARHPDVQKLFRGLLDWRMELPRRQQHRNLDTCYGKCAHDHKVHLNRIRIVHREWNVTFP
jgi:hypothetical protein